MPLIMFTSTQSSYIPKISFVLSSKNLYQTQKQPKLKSSINTSKLPQNQAYKILLNEQINGNSYFQKQTNIKLLKFNRINQSKISSMQYNTNIFIFQATTNLT